LITRIELDGFKTFQDFKLDLSPFQVIVGPNGAGKSNLFDALHLLSHLADNDLRSAFQKSRGDAIELFTVFSNGQIVDKMRLAVEMLVDRSIQDEWGREAELKYTRMRYELGISRGKNERGLERLYVSHESLKAIPRHSDIWCKRHGLSVQNKWLPKPSSGGNGSFISTEQNTILFHPDRSLNRQFTLGVPPPITAMVGVTDRTMLSRVTSAERPHAFAAREEIRGWKFLQLNPEVLRYPSSMYGPNSLSTQGHNLAATLVRMREEEPFLINDVSRDFANLVPGMLKVEVDTDQARNEYIVRAITEDRTSFSSRVLSDGTLRMLALATLRNDPEHHGVLCLEEPENGVHPSRFQSVARVLRDLATNFQDESQVDLPLRQLLANTHSPTFVSQTEVRDALLFAYMVTRIRPPEKGIPPQRVTRIVPVIKADARLLSDLGISQEEEVYTLDQIKDYLNSDSLEDALHDIV
jgi:predicted ATPase